MIEKASTQAQNAHSMHDDLLDDLLEQALPTPPGSALLHQRILQSVQSNAVSESFGERALQWLMGETNWWRPFATGLATLIFGFVIGLWNTQANQQDETDSLYAMENLLSLSDEYEDYHDPF